MIKTIADVIREKGYYVTRPKGTSMFPMLREDRNEICVVRADDISAYDVVLYVRDNGAYVLHRIIGIDASGYVCCGDNQWIPEHGVRRGQIIGRLDRWYKGDREYTVRDKAYLRYVKFWCKSLGLRHFILWFCHKSWQLRSLIKKK